MAISKTQNERPAIIELIDTVNENSVTIVQHGESIASLTGLIANETDERERADEDLSQAIGETNRKVSLLSDAVDAFVDSLADEAHARIEGDSALAQSLAATDLNVSNLDGAIGSLESRQETTDEIISRIKVGETETLTIPANDSYSSSYSFDVPYESTDDCIVILQVITGELSTLFDVTMIDCTYAGFSYQITNSDADPHDVKLGFVAFRTNEI